MYVCSLDQRGMPRGMVWAVVWSLLRGMVPHEDIQCVVFEGRCVSRLNRFSLDQRGMPRGVVKGLLRGCGYHTVVWHSGIPCLVFQARCVSRCGNSRSSEPCTVGAAGELSRTEKTMQLQWTGPGRPSGIGPPPPRPQKFMLLWKGMQAHIYRMVPIPDYTGHSIKDVCLYIREINAWLAPHARESGLMVSF